MNTKKSLTVAALMTLLSVPAFSTGHMAHLSIPKFSDSLMVKAHADNTSNDGRLEPYMDWRTGSVGKTTYAFKDNPQHTKYVINSGTSLYGAYGGSRNNWPGWTYAYVGVPAQNGSYIPEDATSGLKRDSQAYLTDKYIIGNGSNHYTPHTSINKSYSGVPTALVGNWSTKMFPDHDYGYSYSRIRLMISNDNNSNYVGYFSDWYYRNKKRASNSGNGWGAGINPTYKYYGNGKYVIDTSASNGFVSTMQMLDPYDMNVWNASEDGNQYLGTFHKDGAPIYHHTTPTANTRRKKSSKPNIPQNDSNYDKPGSHNIPGETWHKHSKATKHTSYVSLPSSYLGKWYANYDYGPKSAGNGKSVYSPYSVDLGRKQGRYYASSYDNGPIVYTYGTEGGFTGYHYWLKNEQAAGGGNNFRLLPNGELEWHEDTNTWHLHRAHHHTPKSDSTPSSKPTPASDSTPSSDSGANSNSNSSSTSSTNNDNDTDNDNDSGTVTPTASTAGTNGTDSNYQNTQNTNSTSTTPTFNNTNLGSVNNTNDVSNTSSNTDTSSNNKLPQTNESNHTTAEAILGATALTASASLMALDFSKKHKYAIMENTDTKHLSNSNSRSYNKIMGDTFADLSKSLKNL